jgi:aldehyde dehydrogenase (NAD+)
MRETREYKNYINGEWVDSDTGRTFENRNPADLDDLVGVLPKSSEADTNRAIEAAKAAYPKWRAMPAPFRGEIMKKATEILVRKKEEISRIMTREMGKIIKETRGDTQEAIDTGFYAFGEGRRLFSMNAPSELESKFCFTLRQPTGVWGIITPWNFPLALPSWKIFPCLLSGNTAVFKPATDTPATAAEFVKIFEEAGLPKGVLNFVTGGGGEVGEAILKHKDITGIAFTGSSDIGARIGEIAGKTLKKVSLELGGKNAQIVMSDANMELALDGTLWGAFGTTGQRCTATSRLILHEDIYDEYIERLTARASKLNVGDGLDESVEMGPLCNRGQLETVEEYVEIGVKEGAVLVTGGQRLTEGEHANGYFYAPTIFKDVDPNMRIAQEEIFGPVLSVIKIRSLDEAIATLNNSSFGLSSSIYTQDVNAAMKAIELIEAGITYVNGPTIGAECHMPFGGVKDTGNGHREGGWTVYDIYTDWKTVYIDYSGKLQKAQIDDWD